MDRVYVPQPVSVCPRPPPDPGHRPRPTDLAGRDVPRPSHAVGIRSYSTKGKGWDVGLAIPVVPHPSAMNAVPSPFPTGSHPSSSEQPSRNPTRAPSNDPPPPQDFCTSTVLTLEFAEGCRRVNDLGFLKANGLDPLQVPFPPPADPQELNHLKRIL